MDEARVDSLLKISQIYEPLADATLDSYGNAIIDPLK